MIRSLWTASSGMKAQQLNIDTISNNLANVNTTAYKSQRVEFKDLLYSSIKRTNLNDDNGRPVNLEVGHGVMPTATTRNFTGGSLMETQNPLDLAIEGKGFFVVVLPTNEVRYTRDGSFKLSVEGDVSRLTTSDGYYVLTEDDELIVIEQGLRDFSVDELGFMTARDEFGDTVDLGRIRIVNFMNPEGLLSEGRNLYNATAASGEEVLIEPEEMKGRIVQGFLETSNVQIVDEMVRMITAQRAYEISSKTIQTSDEMLQMANNLRR